MQINKTSINVLNLNIILYKKIVVDKKKKLDSKWNIYPQKEFVYYYTDT